MTGQLHVDPSAVEKLAGDVGAAADGLAGIDVGSVLNGATAAMPGSIVSGAARSSGAVLESAVDGYVAALRSTAETAEAVAASYLTADRAFAEQMGRIGTAGHR